MKLDAVKTQLIDRTIETMRTIAKDHRDRLEQVECLSEAQKALSGGLWFTEDYVKAVRALKEREVKVWEPPKECFEDEKEGYAPEEFFLKKGNLLFVTKRGVSASDALDAALAGPVLGDCGMAVQLSYHKAIRDVLGKEIYDLTFEDALVLGVGREPDLLLSAFMHVVEDIPSPSNPQKMIRPMSKGCQTTFQNDPLYTAKFPLGRSRSFNVIYGGEGKYLGLGLPSEGLTAQELRDLSVQRFNMTPDNPQTPNYQTTAKKVSGFIEKNIAQLDFASIAKFAALKNLDNELEKGTVNPLFLQTLFRIL